MDYPPIASYGVIGDLHSVALVGSDGSIDWLCLPAFDSPSLFAALLDRARGGSFQVCAEGTTKQMYLPDSNVLVTRFLSPQAVGEVTDFMPVGKGPNDTLHEVVRVMRSVRGTSRFRVSCRPAFDYARQPHTVTPTEQGWLFEGAGQRFGLMCSQPLALRDGAAEGEIVLPEGQSATVVLRLCTASSGPELLARPVDAPALLQETLRYWREWAARCQYRGRWREIVVRSALVLKLLTYQPTGAIVAAPTTSLPETIGGGRNFDYRFTWVRDAAFTIYAFMRLGYTEEAGRFMAFLQERMQEEETVNGPLNIMYGIDGRHHLPETTLDHLEGYARSRPVRIGNEAAKHLQLDVYGELLDSVYLYDKYGQRLSYDQWCAMRRMADWVSNNWNQPDEGIWEVRGGRQHFTYSKVQCWVALDRTLRLRQKRGLPMPESDHVQRQRDLIYEAVLREGWSAPLNSFVQSFGGQAADASLLMMPLVLFLSPADPRMIGTIERVQRELAVDSLVYRYRADAAADGFTGQEGTFCVCSFWLAEALTRAGRVEEARLLFERMLTYANHLGLYAEEIGPSGELLGNFPQAFTHLGLISAAFSLDRHLGGSD